LPVNESPAISSGYVAKEPPSAVRFGGALLAQPPPDNRLPEEIMFRERHLASAETLHRGRALARLVAAALGGLVLLASGTAAAQATGIRSSKHDFSSSGTGGIWSSADTNQICVFCHTPHNALSTSFLWNRTLKTPVFSVYTSETMSAASAQPRAGSLRCLACHDGSTAVDAFNQGRTWTPRMMAIGDVYYPGSLAGPGGANIGGNYTGNANVNNLTDDHPVSFRFDSVLDPLIQAMSTGSGRAWVQNTYSAEPLPLYGNGAGGQTLECGTCHEVHRKYANRYLLRISVETTSNLCRTCHLK
jgi:predicted CXXCH cytochrome family protein